jgi:hypothetical protein
MKRFIGIDPGETTGIISFVIMDDEIFSVESHELDLIGVGNFISNFVHTNPIKTIVSFELANKLQASGHISSEVIGIVKYFSEKYGETPIGVTQSSHKRLINREVLKRSGLYVVGKHAKDAAGVALYTAVTSYKLVPWVLRTEEVNS